MTTAKITAEKKPLTINDRSNTTQCWWVAKAMRSLRPSKLSMYPIVSAPLGKIKRPYSHHARRCLAPYFNMSVGRITWSKSVLNAAVKSRLKRIALQRAKYPPRADFQGSVSWPMC
jgi:hypothetical protein